ncbi:MAG: hypothetical protein RQ867_07070 [Mariprofundaceae bacterium]|nr:hypothetical protein [Mariprofundaceae bacterium]
MGVRSTIFGGVTLSGEESEKFKRQVKYGRPKAAAHKALAKGLKMTSQMDKNGFAIVKKKKAA